MIRNEVNYLYPLRDDIKTKIEKIATKIYRATEVEFSIEAIEKNRKDRKNGICKITSMYSKKHNIHYQMIQKKFTRQRKIQNNNKRYRAKSRGRIVVALAGKIMTMPGLPKNHQQKI